MKCKPGRFVMGEAVPFGQRWTYGSTDPMSEMMDPEYFTPVSGQVQVGDEIRLLQMTRDSVEEIAEVLVSSVSPMKFYILRKPEKTHSQKGKPGPKPRLRTLEIEEDKGCVYLVDENKKIWGEFANKAEARKAKPELERVA